MVTPYDGYVDVCAALAELTPGDHAKKSALFNSGAEAVENAVKIARHATGRSAVVVFDHAYHGRTNLTMALTAKSMPYKHRFGPFAGEIYRMPMSYPLRDGGLTGEAAAALALGLVEKQVGAENVAAVLIEPIQGEAGIVVPSEGYLRDLRAICDRHNVLLILDEVQSGLGRTGRWFAHQHEGIRPDGLILGKALGGGVYPVSAFLATHDVMSVFNPGSHGSTFGGNALAARIGLEALAIIEEEHLVERSAEMGSYLQDRLRAMRSNIVKDVRGRGLWVGVEVDANVVSARSVCDSLLENGVLSKDTHGTVLRFAPPLTITREEIDWGMERIERVFARAVH